VGYHEKENKGLESGVVVVKIESGNMGKEAGEGGRWQLLYFEAPRAGFQAGRQENGDTIDRPDALDNRHWTTPVTPPSCAPYLPFDERKQEEHQSRKQEPANATSLAAADGGGTGKVQTSFCPSKTKKPRFTRSCGGSDSLYTWAAPSQVQAV